jgi:hypothetical protein
MVDPSNSIGELMAFVQNTLDEIVSTLGVGLTVILNNIGTPLHELEKGVTVIPADMVVLKLLAAVKAVILPEPEAGKPIEVLVLLH